MRHNYTTDQIIKYIYRELPLTEHLETEYAVATYPEWIETYNGLKAGYDALPSVQFFPRTRSLRSILSYSEDTALEARV